MIEHDVEFSADDLADISRKLFVLAVSEQDRSGTSGVAPLYFRLASDLARQWSAVTGGREADAVMLPAGVLAGVEQTALEEALNGLERMQTHQDEYRPDDEPWAFTIGLLRRQVAAEIALRRGGAN